MSRIALLLLVFAFSTSLSNGQTAQDLFQQALRVERLSGNAEAAIALYRQIVDEHSSNRTMVARSLLQMGKVYETLGHDGARASYSRIVQEYSDISSVAREAAQRIEALAELNRGPTFRKIEIASGSQNGVISPDGKSLAFTSEDGLWMVPLQGNVGADIAGEPVRIADVPGAWNLGNVLAWSADMEWIAVNGGGIRSGLDDVYLVPVSGGEPRLIQLPLRGFGYFSGRLSLSPDGGILAFSAQEIGTPAEEADLFALHIYVISTTGGEPRQISSGPGMYPAFSPDGEHIAYVSYYEKEEPPQNNQETRYESDLWIVASSGGSPTKLAHADGRLGGPVWSPDGRAIAARSRWELGGREVSVYPLSPDASSAGEPTVIALSGRSIGIVTGWTPEGELGIIMPSPYISAVYTVPSSGGRAVQVTPDGVVYYPRWSPDGERIFLRWPVLDDNPGSMVVHVPATGGEVTDMPWPSQLSTRVPGGGHNISPNGRNLVVSGIDRSSGEGTSDVWVIPVDGATPTRLTENESHERYPCWSPDGQWIAYVDWHETSEGEGFDTIYRIPAEGGEAVQITVVADSVGAGAIAFSPDGERIAFFSGGAIKTKPIEGGAPEILVADVQARNFPRHSQLAYSPDGSKIAFNTQGNIWITHLNSGETTELQTGLPGNFYQSEFGWSPDGEKIAFMIVTGNDREFWLISDFFPEGR